MKDIPENDFVDQSVPKDPPPKTARDKLDWFIDNGYGHWDATGNRIITHRFRVKQFAELNGQSFEDDATDDGDGKPDCYLSYMKGGKFCCTRFIKTPIEGWQQNPGGFPYYILKKRGGAATADGHYQTMQGMGTYCSCDGRAYLCTTHNGKPECIPVSSDDFKNKARLVIKNETGLIPQQKNFRAALDQITAYALEECEEIEVHIRVAFQDDGIWIDLCDRERHYAHIAPGVWEVVTECPVMFYRSRKMRPLPIPDKGGSMDMLTKYLNVLPEDIPLIFAALVGFFLPEGTLPILAIVAGDGRGKTFLLKVLSLLLDPTKVGLKGAPNKEEDLLLVAMTRYLVLFDNLSDMPGWLSDALCRLVCGGSLERRKLFSDSDLSVFTARRPCILTSIKDVITALDLISRTIKIELPRVAIRKGEKALWKDFLSDRPKILGALYDALATALKNYDTTEVKDPPRLADFAQWIVASGLPGLLEAYREQLQAAVNDVLQSPLADKLVSLGDWQGTTKELAKVCEVTATTDGDLKKFVSEVRVIQTALETRGICVGAKKSHQRLIWTVKKITAEPLPESAV